MVVFHCYVSLPEGIQEFHNQRWDSPRPVLSHLVPEASFLEKKNIEQGPIPSMGRTVYLPTWMLDF